MSELNPSSPNLEPQAQTTLLYRGVSHEDNESRIGQWWTTNPYYALVYANGGSGKMFVARVDTDKLDQLAHNVSQDEGYNNYGFVDHDPPGARVVTQDEIAALKIISLNEASNIGASDLPGGQLLKTPDNPIEAGKAVFDPTFE